MLRPDDVIPVIEKMLEAGEDRRDAIVDAVALTMDVDAFALRRMAADRAVSLALAVLRDDDGERLAFPSRNEDGERTIVHMVHTKDYRALHRAGERLQIAGKAQILAGDRLIERAGQLSLFEAAD